MTAIFYLLLFFCPLTLGLIVFQYRRRAADQELTLDCRLQQHLLEHVQHLPRPVVRCFYGPDVPVPVIFAKRGEM
ncbi:MAG: hypothetical protein ACTFAK_11120 [Candidatus Electronema sp. VV]